MTDKPEPKLAMPTGKHLRGGQAELQRQRQAEAHPELYDKDGKLIDGPAVLPNGAIIPNVVGAMSTVLEFQKKKDEINARAAARLQERAKQAAEDHIWSYNAPIEPWDCQAFVAQMKHWPELIPNKIYPLDVNGKAVVNRPFDSHEACYEAYPNIRSQTGYLIERYISRFCVTPHYSLIDPDKYTMPTANGRHGQEASPAPSLKPQWSAVKARGKEAFNRAKSHFRRKLGKLKTVIYIDDDIFKALDGMTVEDHAAKFGIVKTCDALQAYLDALSNKGSQPMAQQSTEHWATNRANVETVLDKVGAQARKKNIPPNRIEPAALAALRVKEWTKFAGKGADAVATILEAWAVPDEPEEDGEEGEGDEQGAAARDTPPAPPVATAPSSPINVVPHPAENIPRTMTGYGLTDIGKALSNPLPPAAYKMIAKGRPGAGETSLDTFYIRRRFDEVFGVGTWRITPHELSGRVEYEGPEEREKQEWDKEKRKWAENEDGSPKMKKSFWYTCILQAHTFQYAVIMPDGSFQWIDGFTTTDMHENVSRRNAFMGAMTSITAQFFKLMGGKDKVITGEYNFNSAQRDLHKKAS